VRAIVKRRHPKAKGICVITGKYDSLYTQVVATIMPMIMIMIMRVGLVSRNVTIGKPERGPSRLRLNIGFKLHRTLKENKFKLKKQNNIFN